MQKRTKIVCTIGPASESKTILKKMILAGMDCARLNFSHGTYKHHQMLISNIRAASRELDHPVAILADLQGPRIRVGVVSKEGISLTQGKEVILYPEKILNLKSKIS
ncbi:MAG: pyruvate kinase, partial [Patescibacteria group bacterium]